MTPVQKVGQVLLKKPGSWALTMGAMVRTLLGLLCLLLAPVGASQGGEVCLSFPQGSGGLPTFRCPQRPDGTDGRFCCGPCLAPYCCDSEEDRMDQNKCLHVWRMLDSCVRMFTSIPAMQFLEITPTTSPPKIRNRRSSPGDPASAPLWPQFTKVSKVATVSGVVCGIILVPLLIVVFISKCWPATRRWVARLSRRLLHRRTALLNPPSNSSEVFDDSPPTSKEVPPVVVYNGAGPPTPSPASPGRDGAALSLQQRRRPLYLPLYVPLYLPGTPKAATQCPTTSAASSASGPPGEPAAGGEVTLRGDVAPGQGAAAAGKMIPEFQAAVAGDVTPVQGAAATSDLPAGGGKAASPVVSFAAPGVTSTQPVPMEKTIPGSGSSGVTSESVKSEK